MANGSSLRWQQPQDDAEGRHSRHTLYSSYTASGAREARHHRKTRFQSLVFITYKLLVKS